jgi:hypothetical protein
MKTFLVIVGKNAGKQRGRALKKRGEIIPASLATHYKSWHFALENGPITPILMALTVSR